MLKTRKKKQRQKFSNLHLYATNISDCSVSHLSQSNHFNQSGKLQQEYNMRLLVSL